MIDTRSSVGIGIVGYGYWGVNYVRVFNEIAGAYTAAVCDKSLDRLEELGKRFPAVVATADIDALLTDSGIAAVVICTEAASHFPLALRCLNAGKHVLVEKPLTTKVNEAQELKAFAESKRLTLMVGHTFVYNSAVRKLKEYVNKAPDEVYYLHARRTNLGPVRRDVNALWDLATHDIAIFNYLLDQQPEWVSAVASRVLRNGREDVGFISLGYPNNLLGNIHVSWADPNKAREVVVVCSDKRIIFNDLNGLEQVRVFHKGIRPMVAEPASYGEYRLQIRDGDILSPKIEVSEPLKNQCRHFLDCIDSGAQPVTNADAGIAVLRVLQAVDRSVALRGAQVEVEKTEVVVGENGYHSQRAGLEHVFTCAAH